MATKKGKTEENIQSSENTTAEINFSEWLKPDVENVVPDISVVKYSNYALIQVMERDMLIDFLELPGIKKDGKWVINTTRVYLTHSHGQKLAKSILKLLATSNENHNFEKYIPDE